jgi:hypothetical protein
MLRHPIDVVAFCLAITQVVCKSCDAITPLQIPIKDFRVIPDIADSSMREVAAKIGSYVRRYVLLTMDREEQHDWRHDAGVADGRDPGDTPQRPRSFLDGFISAVIQA